MRLIWSIKSLSLQRRVLLCTFLGGFLFLVSAGHLDFLNFKKVYFHDSSDLLVKQYLFYSEFFTRGLPLWRSESNMGQPVWPLHEMVPALDPIALPIWGLCFFLRTSSVVPFTWTIFFWILIFAWGGTLCSRLLYRDHRVNLVVFAILFGGPIAAGLGVQSPGFLLPFRYLPLSLYLFLTLCKRPTSNRAFILGCLLGFGLAGYQAFFSVSFLGIFVLVHLLFSSKLTRHRKGSLPYLFYAFGIGMIILVPDLIAGVKCLNLRLVGRVGGAWFVHPRILFQGATDFFHRTEPWHGHGYIGILPLVLILACPLALCFQKKRGFSALEGAWLLMSVIFTVIVLFGNRFLFGTSNEFLFLRNWGYTLTLLLFSLSQVVVVGYRFLLRVREQDSQRLFWLSLFPPVAFLILAKTVSLDRNYFNRNQLLPLALLPLVILTVQSLRRRRLLFLFPWALLILSYWDLGIFSRSASRFYDLNSLDVKETLSKAPRLHPFKLEFPSQRLWKPESQAHFPYHFEVPTQVGEFFVTSDVEVLSAMGGVMATHWFRLPRYAQIFDSGYSAEDLKRFFRVGKPLLHLTRDIIPSASLEESLIKMRLNQGHSWVVEGLTPAETSQLSGGEAGNGRLDIRDYGPNHLRIRVQSAKPSILVYSDNVDEDWGVMSDGQSAKMLTANGTLKAVFLPSGAHEVEFSYWPKWYVLSFWLRFPVLFLFGLLQNRRFLFQLGPIFERRSADLFPA